jgi:hypothetical protein
MEFTHISDSHEPVILKNRRIYIKKKKKKKKVVRYI